MQSNPELDDYYDDPDYWGYDGYIHDEYTEVPAVTINENYRPMLMDEDCCGD